jgi:uncharacterized membrane protein
MSTTVHPLPGDEACPPQRNAAIASVAGEEDPGAALDMDMAPVEPALATPLAAGTSAATSALRSSMPAASFPGTSRAGDRDHVSEVAKGNGRNGHFPLSSGILLGLGLGGFFDGIVLHQILQWHHMLTSAGYPTNSLRNLQFNTLWDGLFHATTYAFVVAGLLILWRSAQRGRRHWSGKGMWGSLLVGFGLFNLVEGLVNHHLLGLHHVNETVPAELWFYWDIGFLAWGAAMLAGGWYLVRRDRAVDVPG